jgi:hypothetical protein
MNASVVGNRKRDRHPRRRPRRSGGGLAALGLTALAVLGLVGSVSWAQPAGTPGTPGPAGAPPATPASPGAPTKPVAPAKPDLKIPVESVDNNQTLGTGTDRPWAKGVSAEDQVIALRLFREGNSALNDGVFITAVKHYGEALAHWDHPAIHYNRALAMMNLDQPIEVFQSLNKALKYDPKDGPAPLDSDKYDRAKNYMLLVQKQVANVDITCDKVGAKVAVDGNVVFTGPGRHQGLVRVGKHSFVAEKAGYVTSVEAPYIGPGETMRFTLKLYSAEELTRYKRKWSRKWFPWAVAGGGGAVAIASTILYTSGRSDVQAFDARITQCGPDGCPITPELLDMRDRGSTKQTLAWVGVGVGVATIGTGLLLAYVNRVRPHQIRPEDLAKEPGGMAGSPLSSLRVTPLLGPTVAGAAASLHF